MFEQINLNRPVSVLGLGATGVSCVRYCLRKGWPVRVFDSRTNPPQLDAFKQEFSQIEVICGEFDEIELAKSGLVIVSPGVDVNQPAVQKAVAQGIALVGDIELFSLECRRPVIAITGSNGKSTVCDCLGWVLEKNDFNVRVAGNIGTPVLDLLQLEQPDLYVLELSSFQIETLSSLKANVAVVLNVSEDHLDRHHSLDEYAAIKRQLYQMASSAVVNEDDPLTHDAFIPESRVTFGKAANADFRVLQTNDGFQVMRNGNVVISELDTRLKGFHNGLNFAACCGILEMMNLELSEKILLAFCEYAGLAHRCQRVDSDDGVIWINDSKATNVGAALAAIEGFASYKTLYLIAGGDAKGGNISELSPAVNRWVKRVWVYGKDAHLFTEFLSPEICSRVNNLVDAVKLVKEVVKPGDCVLFSPACASLDMYSNYEARGKHFVELVQEVS